MAHPQVKNNQCGYFYQKRNNIGENTGMGKVYTAENKLSLNKFLEKKNIFRYCIFQKNNLLLKILDPKVIFFSEKKNI